MRTLFLGTASGKPSKYRNVTSIAVIMEDMNYILVDCGEATQHQILKSELKLSKLDSIYITHLHGDHIFGLHGLLSTLNEIRNNPLKIYGPIGLSNYINFVRRNIINYTLIVKEYYSDYEYDKSVNIIKQKNYDYHINYCEVSHSRDVKCYAYKITKTRSVPTINIKLFEPVIDKHRASIEASGFKPAEKIISELKKNGSVTLPQIDGNGITNINSNLELELKLKLSDFYNKEDDMSMIIALDNYNCDKMIREFGSCNILVHESTYACLPSMTSSEITAITNLAISHGHSTNLMAFNNARKLGASKLILTHFSNRYEPDEDVHQKIIDGCVTNRESGDVTQKIQIYCAYDFADFI